MSSRPKSLFPSIPPVGDSPNPPDPPIMRRTTRRQILKASASWSALALAGCGGGSSGSAATLASASPISAISAISSISTSPTISTTTTAPTTTTTLGSGTGTGTTPPAANTASASTYTGPLPSWVPAPGTFANISRNRLVDVAPAGYVLNDAAGPFANWGGGRYNPDYSALGGYVVASSGHLPTGEVCWTCTNVFNLETRSWEVKDVPTTAWTEGQQDTIYGQFPDGTFYMPHTYGGLEIQSASNGGGSQGSLIQFFSAGSAYQFSTRVVRYDLSQPVGTFGSSVTLVIDSVPTGGISANYPMTAFDTTRNGWWVLSYTGWGPLFFVDARTYAMTPYPNSGYNDYGDQFMVYLPPPYDFLLGFGRTGSYGVNMSFWGCPAAAPNVNWTNLTANVVGSLPANHACGGCWSTMLNTVVMYEAGGSYRVHSLTPPPPSQLLTGTWTMTSEVFTGVAGATPCVDTAANNGARGRFVEVPVARSFIWCDSVSGPVQAWRLAGT